MKLPTIKKIGSLKSLDNVQNERIALNALLEAPIQSSDEIKIHLLLTALEAREDEIIKNLKDRGMYHKDARKREVELQAQTYNEIQRCKEMGISALFFFRNYSLDDEFNVEEKNYEDRLQQELINELYQDEIKEASKKKVQSKEAYTLTPFGFMGKRSINYMNPSELQILEWLKKYPKESDKGVPYFTNERCEKCGGLAPRDAKGRCASCDKIKKFGKSKSHTVDYMNPVQSDIDYWLEKYPREKSSEVTYFPNTRCEKCGGIAPQDPRVGCFSCAKVKKTRKSRSSKTGVVSKLDHVVNESKSGRLMVDGRQIIITDFELYKKHNKIKHNHHFV